MRALGCALLLAMQLTAAEHLTIPLWPHGMPGTKAASEPERNMTTEKDSLVAGKPVIRLGNVTEPSITLYPAPQANANGTAVVVFPGGGYRILAMDLEGTEVCEWLNSIGITAVLVKYRVPEPKDQPRYAAPLQDAERAVSLVRSRAREWHINPERVGVLGFSAGGHLAAVLASHGTGDRNYEKIDEADTGSTRPNFMMLIYPAYLSVRDEGEELAPEVNVTHDSPPVFLVQTEDDHLFVGGSLLYYRALKRAGVPAEMHLYANGGHGYGLRTSKFSVTHWPALAAEWLAGIERATQTN